MMGETRLMALGAGDQMRCLQGVMAPTAIPTSFRYSCLRYRTHNLRSNPFVLGSSGTTAVVLESQTADPLPAWHSRTLLH
jgi:hypothetical protein